MEEQVRVTRHHADGHAVTLRALPDYDALFAVDFNPSTTVTKAGNVTQCGITDEAGRPVHITAHQWRHTFATTLVNRGVRLEVVKELLDHASLEMASHYARLLDTTIRAEWDAARDDDEDLQHLLPADVEWANRSRTALPNGHCGLPRQQACDHSNKCLTCPSS